MDERTVVDGVNRWFRREFGAGQYCGECTLPNRHRADLVYVQRADIIHVVEAKSSADDARVSRAFEQLRSYPANYKWLALPLEEYEASAGGIASACSDKGYGLFLVSGSHLRLSVEIRRQPVYHSGRFDNRWELG